jgi:hypothetical protein
MIFNFLLSLLLFNLGLVLLTYRFANWSSESNYLILSLILGFVLCIVGYSILFSSLREVVM